MITTDEAMILRSVKEEDGVRPMSPHIMRRIEKRLARRGLLVIEYREVLLHKVPYIRLTPKGAEALADYDACSGQDITHFMPPEIS